MIRTLTIENYKKFAELELAFSRLTLLTGLNSGGKSSVIQSLLLLHSRQLEKGRLSLDGPFGLHLGEEGDILHDGADSMDIRLSMSCDGWQGGLLLRPTLGDAASVEVANCDLPDGYADHANASRQFSYLGAERLGPRDLHDLDTLTGPHATVGHAGQYTTHVLTQLEREAVDKMRRHPQTAEEGDVITFKAQVELWMRDLVGDLQLKFDRVDGANAAILQFKPGGALSGWRRPDNIGFGASYSLPVVVAGLAAARDGVLVVENPEAHLHPRAQSRMGRFLARLASSGVQVIVETHSDHVVNGIRCAVVADALLSPEDVSIYFFRARSGARSPPSRSTWWPFRLAGWVL